jgi:hypothetical protein
MRLSYEVIEPRVLELIERAALFSTFSNVEVTNSFLDELFTYFNFVGWSEKEFDNCLLDKIDMGWELCLN